ncbi:MAG: L-aspartate oxidase [Candidatus Kariarchaeaceae archaeon]|jgi:L-aspartate oxidase
MADLDIITSDVLVIGSGIAGLLYTYNLVKQSDLSVNLITKRELVESNSRYAQGGVAAVLSPTDNFEAHVEDTLVAGAGLCRPERVREIISLGPDIIDQLTSIGVKFDIEDEAIALGREGGHHARRVAHVADATGQAIMDELVKTITELDHVRIFEHHTAVDLVTINNQTAGAYVLNNQTEEVLRFSSRMTVLATGGAGKIFLYTSNPDIASGDGHAMAYRAGATLANMEFIQFHPTLYYNPNFKTFLITEAIRGEGGILCGTTGNRFMEGVHELKELAPRDIVARAIDEEMKRSGADFVLLDISHKDAEFVKERFPSIYSTLLQQGLDMTKEPIPVVPAAHYTIGGVRVETNGKTDVNGLLAIGEVSHTGLHGANRLASNSLLEGAVMSLKAAEYTIETLKHSNGLYSFPPWEPGAAVAPDEAVIVSHNWDEVRRTMWSFVGIVRTTKRLLRALKRLEVLKEEVLEYYWSFHITPDIIELRNLIQISELVVESALFRKESRGAHFTQDYPRTSKYVRETLIQKNLGIFQSELLNGPSDE